MKWLAKRTYATGVLFLLAPIWTFPFIDEIALWRIESKAQYRSILDFDMQRADTEYMTFHYLYVIGCWITLPSLGVLALYKIYDAFMERTSVLPK
jgi:hypothetical protein